MEVLETPRKILPEGSSLAPDPSNAPDPDAITFGTSSAEIRRGDVFRVSVNRKEARGYDLEFRAVEIKASNDRDCGAQKFVALDDKERVLEDFEMNGVSSLLKMHEGESFRGLGSVLNAIDKDGKGGFVNIDGDKTSNLGLDMNGESFDANMGNPDWKIGEVSESEDGEGQEDMEDEGHEFSVGDFVWGKVKSHPWWPGRIYDPLDASDYAKKLKRGDKILVAYFGDGTFAWCNPSQLRPFEENFAAMSKQSSLKNFVNAVKKAVDEVGRLVDMKMTCHCVPQENLIGFGRSLAMNAGIKEGLLVPEGGIEKFSTAFFEPTQLVSALKGVAQVATITNMLKFSILKSWLSAFFRAKGGYQLPTYSEPEPIPGLDDDTKSWVVDSSNYNGGVEAAFQGPVEDEWLSSPSGPTFRSLLQKCQGLSCQRRKQKSIAEILGTNTNTEFENEHDKAEGETKVSKQASLAERKKRKGSGELDAESRPVTSFSGEDDAEGKNKVGGDEAKAELNSGKLPSLSGRTKRTVGDEADGEDKIKVGDVTKPATNPAKPAGSSGSKGRKRSDEINVDSGNESISKARKKEMMLSESVVAAENKISSPKIDETAVKGGSKKTPSRGRKKNGRSSIENDSEGKNKHNTVSVEKKIHDGSSIRSDDGETAEQIGKGFLSRERKKSKYLSPPYTNLGLGQRKREIEAESHEKSYEELDTANETSYESCPQMPKHDQNNVINPRKVKTPTNALLSQIRSAALSPQYFRESKSLKTVEEFFSAFRSSVYCNGLYYKLYNHHPGAKREFQESELVQWVEQTQSDYSSSDYKSQRKKTKKNGEAKSDKPKAMQVASAPDLKTNDKEPDGKAPAAALFVTFGPGSSLPAKNDLIRLYGKFGELNTQETEMFYNNYCARIVFFNSSEAEEAFNDSQLASPFGSASVTFRLLYLSADTKTRELSEVSGRKPSAITEEPKTNDKSSASQPHAGDVSQLKYIRQRLEVMTSMLDMSDGKMSPDIKSKLEGEMKGLLEKVSTMVASSFS